MTVDSLLSSWQDAPEAERRSILAALQVFADAESQAVKNEGLPSIVSRSAVDVYAAHRDGQDLVVHYSLPLPHGLPGPVGLRLGRTPHSAGASCRARS